MPRRARRKDAPTRASRDDIEQIAMLAGRGISPFAGGAFPAVRSNEANEQAAAGRVPDVADDPVATPAAAV